jgi:hypothetical protein
LALYEKPKKPDFFGFVWKTEKTGFFWLFMSERVHFRLSLFVWTGILMVLLGIVGKKFACFFTALRCFCNAMGARASRPLRRVRDYGSWGLDRSLRRPCAKAPQRTRSLCALCEASAPLAVKKHRDAVKNRTILIIRE